MVAEGTSYRAEPDLSRADLSRAKSAWLSLRERSELNDLRNRVRCSCRATMLEVVEVEVEGKNVLAWSWSRSPLVMCSAQPSTKSCLQWSPACSRLSPSRLARSPTLNRIRAAVSLTSGLASSGGGEGGGVKILPRGEIFLEGNICVDVRGGEGGKLN